MSPYARPQEEHASMQKAALIRAAAREANEVRKP